jgi:hypothetical protein
MAAVRVNGKRASLAKFSGWDVTNEFGVAPAGVASGDHSMAADFEWSLGGAIVRLATPHKTAGRDAGGTGAAVLRRVDLALSAS